MKKCLIILLIMVMVGTAIAEETTMLVSKEEFLGKSSYSEEETRSIDIDKLIAEREINQFLLDLIPQRVIDSYIYQLLHEYPVSYEIMEQGKDKKQGGLIDFTQAKWCAISFQDDAAVSSLVLDFENRRVYFDPQRFIWDNVCYAEVQTDLSDEIEGRVLSILSDAEVSTWELEYLSEKDNERGQTFLFDVQLSDKAIEYSSTSLNSNAPIKQQIDFYISLVNIVLQ